MSDYKVGRRSFIKAAGVVGGAAWAGVGAIPRARAQAASTMTHDLPLYVSVIAPGGMDVGLCIDPKSGPLYPLNLFTSNDYQQIGAFTLAPECPAVVQFFQKYYQKILLINGIFAETNSHTAGQKLACSGSTDPTYPTFSAIVAAAYGQGLGLPFISSGGNDETAQLVAKTLVTQNLTEAMQSVITSGNGTLSAQSQNILRQAISSRLNRQIAAATVKPRQDALNEIMVARQGWSSYPGVIKTLADLQANVPRVSSVTGGPSTDTTDTNTLFLGAQVALAGYVNNATVSATLLYGNFDQHSGFPVHPIRIDGFFVGLDYFWRAASYLGVADRIVLVTGSDFSRSPFNIDVPGGSGGKAHWYATTSSMVMGQGITGNRVIGESTLGTTYNDASYAVPLDINTLKPAASGTYLLRSHLHYELRRIAGVLDTDASKAFPLTLSSAPMRLLE